MRLFMVFSTNRVYCSGGHDPAPEVRADGAEAEAGADGVEAGGDPEVAEDTILAENVEELPLVAPVVVAGTSNLP